MRSITKFLIPVMAASLAITLFSCNGSSDEKKEEKKTGDSTAVVETKPFKLLVVQHKVADFAKWKAGYLAHDSMRTAYGLFQFRLGRGLDDSNLVIVINKMSDVPKAKEFAASPGLKDAMQKAGVIGQPIISYIDLVRVDTSMLAQQERIMVTHKVKDFDTWLKAYDAEGKATRASFGMVDRVLGRSTDNPNVVYLVFAITDMAKAKARFSSPELKKIMTDAGVEGPPTSVLFKLGQ